MNYMILLCYYLPIFLHDMFKWSEEVFLKGESRKFSFLQELHGQLSQ